MLESGEAEPLQLNVAAVHTTPHKGACNRPLCSWHSLRVSRRAPVTHFMGTYETTHVGEENENTEEV